MSDDDTVTVAGLSPEEIVEVPLDRLAVQILRDAEDGWNVRNWMRSVQQHRGVDPASPAGRALAEAWQWLFNHGLVTHDFEQTAQHAFQVTRLGKRVIEDPEAGLAEVKARARLDVDLHQQLEDQRVHSQFLLGDFEAAAFKALRAVEIAVRDKIGAADTAIGYQLMREAFKPDEGPLSGDELSNAEQQARSDLYAGAIGLFKNPPSHRVVDYTDATEAVEIVLLADLLLRLLERIPDPDQDA